MTDTDPSALAGHRPSRAGPYQATEPARQKTRRAPITDERATLLHVSDAAVGPETVSSRSRAADSAELTYQLHGRITHDTEAHGMVAGQHDEMIRFGGARAAVRFGPEWHRLLEQLLGSLGARRIAR